MTALAEAKRYLWLLGTATDTTIDPADLIRDLVVELEQHRALGEIRSAKKPKKPKARSKR